MPPVVCELKLIGTSFAIYVVCNIRRLQSKELVKAVLLSQLLLIAIQVKLRGVIPAELFQRSYSSGVISATRIE
jgi:hypothetical protein